MKHFQCTRTDRKGYFVTSGVWIGVLSQTQRSAEESEVCPGVVTRCVIPQLGKFKFPTLLHNILSNWDMASIRLYTLTVVFVLVEWNNAVFYSNIYKSWR